MGAMMSESAYRPKPFEISSVELFGYRLPDGTIKLFGDKINGETCMQDFPKEIDVCGATYTLEEIKK